MEIFLIVTMLPEFQFMYLYFIFVTKNLVLCFSFYDMYVSIYAYWQRFNHFDKEHDEVLAPQISKTWPKSRNKFKKNKKLEKQNNYSNIELEDIYNIMPK